jgi:hypothetical protein
VDIKYQTEAVQKRHFKRAFAPGYLEHEGQSLHKERYVRFCQAAGFPGDFLLFSPLSILRALCASFVFVVLRKYW